MGDFDRPLRRTLRFALGVLMALVGLVWLLVVTTVLALSAGHPKGGPVTAVLLLIVSGCLALIVGGIVVVYRLLRARAGLDCGPTPPRPGASPTNRDSSLLVSPHD